MTPAVDIDGLDRRLAAEAGRIERRDAYSDRLRPAAETVRRLRGRFGEFGITRLAETTGLDRIGIPVWAAVRPNARTLAVCQGKGIDVAAAQASAVMEAVEVATAERCDLAVRRCAAADLARRGERFLRLDGMVRRGKTVPPDDEPIDWLAGFDLLRQVAVWVPAEAATLDHTEADGRYSRSTDGLASGNLLVEAVLHGLCERIERDAGALWRFASETEVAARCRDPLALGDPVLRDLAGRVAEAGLHLRLFDVTTDVGIPVFFATVSPVPDGGEVRWLHFDLSSGFGCHPAPVRAALRAVTEAVQSRLTVISGARDDFDPALYGRRLAADLLVYVRAVPASYPSLAGEPTDMATQIATILRRLAAVGVASAVVVPLRVDDEFAVAKVVVPDLETLPGSRRNRLGPRGLAAMMRRQ